MTLVSKLCSTGVIHSQPYLAALCADAESVGWMGVCSHFEPLHLEK